MKISFDKDEILSAIDRVAKKTMTMDLTWEFKYQILITMV